MKSCFLIGHAEASSEVLPALAEAVEQPIIEFGVRQFVVGNNGGFDRMAVKTLVAAKVRHPGIILSMLIPYHPAERSEELPCGFDNTFYPPRMEKVPRKLAIVRVNRYMVDHADYLIAYPWHPGSNARDLVEYAGKRQKQNRITITVLPRC